MIITVACIKGGVAKTTTALHLAAYLQKKAPTLLIDGDAARWPRLLASRGGLPFKVIDACQTVNYARYIRDYDHVVIVTNSRPGQANLKAMVNGSDLLVIPTTPDSLSLCGLRETLDAVKSVVNGRYKVLLTIIPPCPSTEGNDVRELLAQNRVPQFNVGIPRLAVFQTAATAGVPVYKVKDPRSYEAWAAYEQVGDAVMRQSVTLARRGI